MYRHWKVLVLRVCADIVHSKEGIMKCDLLAMMIYVGTLRGSALVNGFDWGAIFIWVPSWFTSWSFLWTTYLTGTLRGTAGRVAFMNIYTRVLNTYLCTFPIANRRLAGDGLCSA